jgi:hypothetical protein
MNGKIIFCPTISVWVVSFLPLCRLSQGSSESILQVFSSGVSELWGFSPFMIKDLSSPFLG